MSAPRVMQDLAAKCWDADPAQRPSFEKVLDLLKDAATKV
jgi:hypothetical protein